MPRAHIRVQLNVMRLTWHCWTGQVTSVCCFINSLLKEPCINQKHAYRFLFANHLKVVRTDMKYVYTVTSSCIHQRMINCPAGIPVFQKRPLFADRRCPHPDPISSLCASVCRTLSPLEPDVPKIPSVWLSLHCDSHHRINENIREEVKGECRERKGPQEVVHICSTSLFNYSLPLREISWLFVLVCTCCKTWTQEEAM